MRLSSQLGRCPSGSSDATMCRFEYTVGMMQINAELAVAVETNSVFTQRTATFPTVSKTSYKHFDALPAGQPRGTQEGVPAARGQQ